MAIVFLSLFFSFLVVYYLFIFVCLFNLLPLAYHCCSGHATCEFGVGGGQKGIWGENTCLIKREI